MKPSDILLAALPQSDGTTKHRPVLYLKAMPPFHDFLVCGISTQLQQAVPDFDEIITPTDSDFRTSRLKSASVIRLGYLAVLPRSAFQGRIGSVSSSRLQLLLTKLADYLRPSSTP
jgi:mRNA interferase MazF